MTTLRRLIPASTLAVAFLLLGCENLPTADTASDVGDQVLLKKGGGKPGGPAEITILFDDHTPRRGYYIVGMDRTGAHTRVLSDANEIGINNLAPRWAPDGVHFVYRRSGDEIVVGNVDGTIAPILSSPAPSLDSPDWSPQPLDDGQERIAYLQYNQLTQRVDLYVMRTDGSDVQQLTDGPYVENLVWSRDATQILAAVRNGVTNISSHLVLFDVTCDASGCVVTGSTVLDLSAFGIAPNDRLEVDDWAHLSDRVLIHYVQAGYYGLRELGILDLTGGSPSFTWLTDNPGGQAYNSAWSWDDSEVVYVKFPAGKKPHPGIVIRDVATGVDTKIYDGAAHFGMDWRPTAPTGG